jgi:hypothetical protein
MLPWSSFPAVANLRQNEGQRERLDTLVEVLLGLLQLLAARGGELVEACLSADLGQRPKESDPAGLLILCSAG